jgi:hypothetical protein
MAKKDKKKKDKQKGSDATEAIEAVRSAVERTFQATTEGAASTSKRTRNLVDEVAAAAARIKETIDDLKILEDVRGLRAEIEGLTRRVAALEVSSKAATRAAPAKRRATAKRTTAKRTTAKRTPAKRTPAKRTAAKRTSAKRTPAKRTAKAKSAPAKPSSSS